MPFNKARVSGMSIIELMIGITILAILIMLAAPSFARYSRNLEVRNAAESVSNGVQKARIEAISRNTNVQFFLSSDSSWTVSVVNPSTQIESRSETEGSQNASLAILPAGATTLTFNNIGLVIANADASPSLTQVDVSASGGDKTMRVVIGVGGSAKLCDPGLAPGSNARAC